MKPIEIWKGIEDLEDYYEVSNFGRVRSLNREIFNGKGSYIRRGKILTYNKIKGKESLRVRFYIGNMGINISYEVSRLVWITFNNKIDSTYSIQFKDKDYTNLRLENLFILSMKGVYKKEISTRANFWKARNKVIFQYTDTMKLINEFTSVNEASKYTGVNESSINVCATGTIKKKTVKKKNGEIKIYERTQKTAGGFIWKYIN